MRAIHAYVTGRVQGVFFRQSTRHRGRRLGLDGWVRNLGDGRVEAWAQGEETAVERFVEWLWEGPPNASVTGVESHDVDPDGNLQDFLIVN
ncbi:MAG: acylphosphatase [Actinobacteria bacterium]|nr:acylphosphatase [Actinomycetota bacterium]NIS37259.1 acylphosphatase [Actinomycetota bacterium]NIU71695.1 acylphosphatase [Actinomycetota bacterium]NIV91002.1 acylphosphatase [Actinomycetota bacterium]NIW33647.1 acylphosphatase [Actinomycetota bacterium]